MLQEAQRAIPNGKFYNHSIFKPVTDAGITLPTADTVLVIHSAYYGYGRDKAAAKDTSELEILLDNVQIASGSGTAVLAMHKSPKESTNGFKEKHSSVVESHATAALGQLMKAKGMKSFSYEFPGEIRVPTFGDVRPMSEKAKELAQFLSHTDINAITPQKAEQICTDFLTLCQKHLFVLPTFTEVSLSTERGASQGFVRGLEGVAKKMQAIASYRA